MSQTFYPFVSNYNSKVKSAESKVNAPIICKACYFIQALR